MTYLCRVLVLIGLGLVVVACFNWLINPFSVFAPPLMPGVNEIKPDFLEHLRLSGPYSVAREKPAALIIGTSRAARGFSPTHSGWAGLRCYNLSLPGINSYEILRYFQHAHAIHRLQKAVIGLDFRVFSEVVFPKRSLVPGWEQQGARGWSVE